MLADSSWSRLKKQTHRKHRSMCWLIKIFKSLLLDRWLWWIWPSRIFTVGGLSKYEAGSIILLKIFKFLNRWKDLIFLLHVPQQNIGSCFTWSCSFCIPQRKSYYCRCQGVAHSYSWGKIVSSPSKIGVTSYYLIGKLCSPLDLLSTRKNYTYLYWTLC